MRSVSLNAHSHMTTAMNIEKARFNMIEQQIRPWDVLDQEVLSVLSLMQREHFVPPQQVALAFVDTELPLGHGQCMLPPKTEARMLQALALKRHERALEIGTGSGYMAALLSCQAREVVSLETVPELVALAQKNLARASIHNVQVVQADGAQPLSVAGPFDAIVLSGSVAQQPSQLLAQLSSGGRLLAVLGQAPMMRATLFTCVAPGQYRQSILFDTVLPRLSGFGEPTRFVF
jgi:protein-L-isoaspartate(D-aspartate) O-methyltransferase